MSHSCRRGVFLHLLGLLALGAAELAVFWRATAGPQAWIYPRWYDQVQYLTDAYKRFGVVREQGWIAGIWEALAQNAPQGALHDLWTLPSFALFGPTRSGALMVNAAALLLLQLSTFLAAKKATGSSAVAWLGVALLAAVRGLWNDAGSMLDYRLDWMAACGFGAALAAAIASDGFRSRGGAVLFGVAVGLTVLTRFLTGTYFVLIFAALLAWVFVQPDARAERGRRLVLAGMVAVLLAGPILWLSRQAIHDYYWIGHVVGPELALRHSHFGPGDSAVWLVSELAGHHLGLAAGGLYLGILLGLRLLRSGADRPPKIFAQGVAPEAGKSASARPADPGRSPGSPAEPRIGPSTWVPVLLFFWAPAIVLALHPVKSPQPVSILVPPVLWAALLGTAAWARKTRPAARGWVAAGAVFVSAGVFALAFDRPAGSREALNGAARLNALADYLCYRAEECGLGCPRVAVTRISPGLSVSVFHQLSFERQGRWVDFEQTLPTGLYDVSDERAMRQLEQSDFVCLILTSTEPPWPFDRVASRLLPRMQSWCDDHLRSVGKLELPDCTVALYERPEFDGRGAGGAAMFRLLVNAAEETGIPAGPRPPFAPRFLESPLRVLWPAGAESSFELPVAFTPLTLAVEGLPEGLWFDASAGQLRGRVASPGTWEVRVAARNSLGSTEARLRIDAVAGDLPVRIQLPSVAAVDEPVVLRYEAVDPTRKLDFVDVSDATEGRLLDRLAVPRGRQERWRGDYALKWSRPGRHVISLRFVRFDPSKRDPYSFFDEAREIEVR